MLSFYLDDDIGRLREPIRKIKRQKPSVVALQGAPRLSEEEVELQITRPLEFEYNVYRSEILHNTDNLLLIKRGTNKVRLVRDTEAYKWMLESNVSMCGVVLEPLGTESNENQSCQVIFSIFVEPGANEGDVINNAYFIRKILTSKNLSSANLVLLCEFVDESYVKLFKMILDINIDANLERRSTRRRSNGS